MQYHITINTILLYLDPGTGSLLIQSIIAAVTGGLVFYGHIKRKLISIFHKEHNNSDAEGE